MKIIFLDVDGVLNSCSFASRLMAEEGVDCFSEDILDPKCLTRLRHIVRKTGAEIVLSSSWRSIYGARMHLVDQLKKFGLSIHSDTPRSGKDRGDDITAWFEQHKDVPVEAYVILDDDCDMGVHIMHLVRTSFFDWGLETRHVQQAIEILTKDERGDGL